MVLEHGGTDRYPMVKLLTSAEGSQWVGWVLAEDVETDENSKVTTVESENGTNDKIEP